MDFLIKDLSCCAIKKDEETIYDVYVDYLANMPYMRKQVFVFLAGLTLSLVVGGFFILYREGVPTVHASRYVLDNGDIYLATDVIGSKRVTTKKDVAFLFAQKNQRLLIAKNPQGGVPGTEQTDSVQLYLLSPDTATEEKITADLVDWATFDKKGERVLYTSRQADINLYDPATKNTVKVAKKAVNPDIAYDGSRVVYKKLPDSWQAGQYYDGSRGLFVKELKSDKEKQLTSAEADYAPFFSPDGAYVIFYGNSPEGLNSLFMVNADGSGRTQLSNVGETFVSDRTIDSPSEAPIWSSDGRYLVYESDRRIWINELDLANKRLVAATPIAYGVSPQWVEDGKTLSIVSSKGGKDSSALLVVDLKGNIIR